MDRRTTARRGRIAPWHRSGKRRPGRSAAGLAVIAALALAVIADPTVAAEGWQRKALPVVGMDRHYWLQPAGGGTAAATMVLLQGALEDPRAFAETTGLPALAHRDGFTLVVPETVDGHWNDGRRTVYFGMPSTADDLDFLTRLLDRLVGDGTARADAIYLAGFSNGGLMALTLACRLAPIRPAGLIVAAATLGEAALADCRPPVPVALVLANGTADALFPYGGGMGLVNGRSGEPMLSAPATAAYVAHSNGCGARRLLAAGPEAMGRGHAVIVDGFAGCPPGGTVVEVTVTGGGHEWPPGEVATLGAAAGSVRPASLAELAWSALQRRAP